MQPGCLLAGQVSTPLAVELRSRVVGDDHLHDLARDLRDHLGRGLRPFDGAGRARAKRRFERLVPGLGQRVAPVLWAEAAKRYDAPPSYPGAFDPLASMKAHAVNGRLTAIVARFFAELQGGELGVRGRPAGNPAAVIDVLPDLWGSPAVALDLAVSTIWVGGQPAFVDVTVSPPAPRPRGVSRLALDRFTRAFGDAIAATDREFVLGELIVAVGQELGATSDREISEAIRRASPRAWAGAGRRAAALTPTEEELCAAARKAAEAARSPA
jgi:hypothetical protein